MFYKATLATLASLILITASTVPVWADEEDPVVTARITFPDSIGDLVLLDDDGEYTASVELFQLGDDGWEQIEIRATLRVFEDQLLGDPIDRVSVPFDSSADEAVNVTFSGEEFSGGPLDVFITFSSLDGNPTSHHHVVKNILISAGQHDAATEFNGPSHRVIAL